MRSTWVLGLIALATSLAWSNSASAQDALPESAPLEQAEPGNSFGDTLRRPAPGFVPAFGIGEGIRLQLSGSILGRVEHKFWTLDDTLPLFPGHDRDEHEDHAGNSTGHAKHGPIDLEDADTTHFESRVRVAGDLILGPSWNVRLELQHSRLWSNNRNAVQNHDQLDLYQGYVELVPGADWAVRVGRFSVPSFGDERIMSGNEWDSLGRALDGVAATWKPDGAAVTLLAVNTGIEDPVRSSYEDDDDFWFGGMAVELRQLEWLDADFYAFGRYFDRSHLGEEHTPHPPHGIRPGDEVGRRTDVTLGSLLAIRGGGVRLVGEIYGQLGQHGPDTVRAWASAERIEYTPWDGDWHGIPAPTMFFEHAFASGDKRYTDGVRNTFDPLFANYHDHMGPFDAVGYRNINALAIGFSQSMALFWEKLRPITFHFVARGSFLASQNDAWYDAQGNEVLRDPTGDTASSRTLEGELSGWFTGRFHDGTLEFSAGLAHWCPNNLAADLDFHEHSYRFWFSTQVRF
jgi:hypothetical protein